MNRRYRRYSSFEGIQLVNDVTKRNSIKVQSAVYTVVAGHAYTRGDDDNGNGAVSTNS